MVPCTGPQFDYSVGSFDIHVLLRLSCRPVLSSHLKAVCKTHHDALEMYICLQAVASLCRCISHMPARVEFANSQSWKLTVRHRSHTAARALCELLAVSPLKAACPAPTDAPAAVCDTCHNIAYAYTHPLVVIAERFAQYAAVQFDQQTVAIGVSVHGDSNVIEYTQECNLIQNISIYAEL